MIKLQIASGPVQEVRQILSVIPGEDYSMTLGIVMLEILEICPTDDHLIESLVDGIVDHRQPTSGKLIEESG